MCFTRQVKNFLVDAILLEMVSWRLHQFQISKEFLLFKMLGDLSHDPPLNPMWLDSNKCIIIAGRGPQQILEP